MNKFVLILLLPLVIISCSQRTNRPFQDSNVNPDSTQTQKPDQTQHTSKTPQKEPNEFQASDLKKMCFQKIIF